MVERICWIVLGLIHLTPSLALFRPGLISRLYGVEPGGLTYVLLRHRAGLFLLVLVLCVWAAVRPEVRPLASVTVGISMLSFLWLYVGAGRPAPLRQIAVMDLLGIPFLGVAAWLAFAPEAGTTILPP